MIMDNNLLKDDFQDKFLKDFLCENIKKENAPKNFTKSTMDMVMQEWINNPVDIETNKHGYKYWIITILGAIIAITIYLATDTRKIITMSDIAWLKSFDKQYLIYIHSFLSNIVGVFLRISPIVYIVLAGLFALYLADKLLRKTHSIHSFLSI